VWSDWFKPRRQEVQVLIGRSFWAVHQLATGWQSGACNDWLEGLLRARQVLDASATSRLKIQVWFSGAMCPALWLVPPEGLREDENKAWVVVAAVAQHPFRSELTEPVVWVDSTVPGECLATAVPSNWLKQIQDVLGPSRVMRVAPLWSSAFAGVIPGSGAGLSLCSAFDSESLTSFEFDGERIAAISGLAGLTELGQAQSYHLRHSIRADFAVTQLLRLSPKELELHQQALPRAWSEVAS
jgi:hypothetical protein